MNTVVTLNLSETNMPTLLSSMKLPNAPLVKISLSPENTGRSMISSNSTSTSSISSPNTAGSLSVHLFNGFQ
jgi:hypothetical protein